LCVAALLPAGRPWPSRPRRPHLPPLAPGTPGVLAGRRPCRPPPSEPRFLRVGRSFGAGQPLARPLVVAAVLSGFRYRVRLPVRWGPALSLASPSLAGACCADPLGRGVPGARACVKPRPWPPATPRHGEARARTATGGRSKARGPCHRPCRRPRKLRCAARRVRRRQRAATG
jgi:hypothetical protein